VIPGTRLTTVSSRFLRAETFDLMVSPAIADLQFEAPTASRVRRLQSYAGVWRACCGALCQDIALTLKAPFVDEARRAALQSDVLTFAWLTLFQVCYYAGMLTIAFSKWSDLRAWLHTVLLRTSVLEALMLGAVALLLPALPVLACFWPRRDDARTC